MTTLSKELIRKVEAASQIVARVGTGEWVKAVRESREKR